MTVLAAAYFDSTTQTALVPPIKAGLSDGANEARNYAVQVLDDGRRSGKSTPHSKLYSGFMQSTM